MAVGVSPTVIGQGTPVSIRSNVPYERWAEGKFDRLPELAPELVRLKMDVIVAAGAVPVIRAAKQATSTIPSS